MAMLTQGQSYAGGTVQFDSATGRRLDAGQTTAESKDQVGAMNTTLTPAMLNPSTPIQIPPNPAPTNPLPNGITPITPQTGSTPQVDTMTTDWMKQLMESLGTPPSASDTYQQDYNASGIAGLESERAAKKALQKQAQDEFNTVQAQLQGVALEAQAIPIQIQQSAQEGGANVTKGGLAPIQTAALRNNALRAIPLQAQGAMAQAKLAAAQGDTALAQDALDSAVNHLDKIYEMHMTDAQNMYNYKKDIRDKVYDFATRKQQQQIDAMNRADDRAFSIKQNSISNAQSLSRLAVENGLGSIATQIAGLEPDSPTYQKDLAKLQGQIATGIAKKQQADAQAKANADALAASRKAPETIKVGEATMAWNPDTKQWEAVIAPAGAAGGLDTQKSKDQFNLMFQTIDSLNAPEIYGASGRSEGRKFIQGMVYGAGDYGNLEALTNTLRTNMLVLQTDPNIKKFFGPQMSNADVQLMTAAGTTVNPALQSPDMLKAEVARIQDLMVRARQSLDGVTQWSSTPSGTRVGLYPDGIIRDIDGNHYDANGKKIYDAKTGKNL
jgi:hypothetical protein